MKTELRLSTQLVSKSPAPSRISPAAIVFEKLCIVPRLRDHGSFAAARTSLAVARRTAKKWGEFGRAPERLMKILREGPKLAEIEVQRVDRAELARDDEAHPRPRAFLVERDE